MFQMFNEFNDKLLIQKLRFEPIELIEHFKPIQYPISISSTPYSPATSPLFPASSSRQKSIEKSS